MISSNLSDSELASLLRDGDRSAFKTIYYRFAEELFNYVAQKVETRQDCEKIITETFEEIWANNEFTPGDLRPYLFDRLRKHLIKYARNNATSELFIHLAKRFNESRQEGD
jgi:DNA-directed RNA polymerase specialized sigma24 family protein